MNSNIHQADIEAAVKKRAAKNIALTYLGLTSFVVTFPYGFSIVSKLVPEWIAWLPAAVISLLIYRFIDGDLADSLRYIEKTAGKGSANRRRKVAKVAAALLLVATASFTYVANFFVANTAIKPPDIEQLKEGEAANLSAYSDKSGDLSEYLSEAKRDLSEAKREGHRLVESARYSSNPEWGQRLGPHLAYAQTQERKGKLSGAFRQWYVDFRQAQTDSAQLVGTARRNLSEVKGVNLAHLSVTPDSLNRALETAFLSELNWSTELRAKFSTFLVFTDGVAAIVIYFCHFWLCLFFKDGGSIPESRASWQYHSDKYLSGLSDKMKQRFLPAEIDDIPSTNPAQPTSGPSRPDVVPVRSGDPGDAWEIKRRQEMAEAKIEEMERRQAEQLRQIEAQRAEEARQNAERIRQAEARAAKLEEERRQADKPKPLSDKGSSDLSAKLSAQITDKGISVGGEVYGVSELSKLKDKSQKWYNRQYTSSTDKGRADNKARWDAIKPVWEKIGATLTYSGQKVSIEGGQLKAR